MADEQNNQVLHKIQFNNDVHLCVQGHAVSSEALNNTIASLTAQVQQLQTAVVALSIQPDHMLVSAFAVLFLLYSVLAFIAAMLACVVQKLSPGFVLFSDVIVWTCLFSKSLVSH